MTRQGKNNDNYFRRGVNRLTDQRILTVFSPGFRIQSKILTDLRILQLQRFAVFIDFWARSLDFDIQNRHTEQKMTRQGKNNDSYFRLLMYPVRLKTVYENIRS